MDDLKNITASGKFSIYCIKNKQNGLKYIGQTIQPVKDRWYSHKWWAEKELSSALIHKAIKEFSVESFEFTVLCTTDNYEELDRLEVEHIKSLNTLHPHGYNMQSGGQGGRLHPDFVKSRRDRVKEVKDLTETALKELADLCRKKGVKSLKFNGLEIVMGDVVPESNYKRKKAESKSNDTIQVETPYGDEAALFWSSAGIVDAEGIN